MVNLIAIGFSKPIVGLFFIYMAYLLFGSLCFVKLETEADVRAKNETRETIQLTRNIIRALRKENMTDQEIFTSFQQKKKEIDHIVTGWRALFGDKVFFAFILITTVGYGNVYPSTTLGQVVCILYTLGGLPLHAIMMRLLSFKFRGGLRKMLKTCRKHYPSARTVLVLGSVLFFVFWTGIFIMAPAAAFQKTENWTYSRGVYFSFVSLTTIGLGDYVAGFAPEDQYYSLDIFVTILWMILGLGFFATALNMLSYLMGVGLLDKLDCRCEARSAAKSKMAPLLDLVKELNWQLLKYKPDNFHDDGEIEKLKKLLTENPQDVTHEMLLKMFRIVTDLREKTYEQIADILSVDVPATPIITHARDNLPDVLSRDSTTIGYSQESVSNRRVNPSGSRGSLTSLTQSQPRMTSPDDSPRRKSTGTDVDEEVSQVSLARETASRQDDEDSEDAERGKARGGASGGPVDREGKK